MPSRWRLTIKCLNRVVKPFAPPGLQPVASKTFSSSVDALEASTLVLVNGLLFMNNVNKCVAVVAICGLTLGCNTTLPDNRWEYKTVSGISDDSLNHLLEDGWSVAGFSQYEGGAGIRNGYLLKRPQK